MCGFEIPACPHSVVLDFFISELSGSPVSGTNRGSLLSVSPHLTNMLTSCVVYIVSLNSVGQTQTLSQRHHYSDFIGHPSRQNFCPLFLIFVLCVCV